MSDMRFIQVPTEGDSTIHEVMADSCCQHIPQLKRIIDKLDSENKISFSLSLWDVMEPIYQAILKHIEIMNGYNYWGKPDLAAPDARKE